MQGMRQVHRGVPLRISGGLLTPGWLPESPTTRPIERSRSSDRPAHSDLGDIEYSRLLGCPPSFYPNDIEAVWRIGDGQWLYITVQPDRAGGAVCTLLGEALTELTREIAQRSIQYDAESFPEKDTRKAVYIDPDGNEIGFASVTA